MKVFGVSLATISGVAFFLRRRELNGPSPKEVSPLATEDTKERVIRVLA